MDPTDQFFKNKLGERRYEYRDSYWLEAERLIEQQEGRRRRAFWWWVFGLALLLGGLGGAGWWYLGTRSVEGIAIGAFRIGQHSSQEGKTDVAFELLPDGLLRKERGRDSEQHNSLFSGVEQADTPASREQQARGRGEGVPKAMLRDGEGAFTGKTSKKEPSAGSPEAAGRLQSEKSSVSPEVGQEANPENGSESRPIAMLSGKKWNTDSLATLLGPVRSQAEQLDVRFSALEVPIRSGKLVNWELALATTLNPNRGLAVLGGIAGWRASYRIRERMSLSLGAQYRLRGGTFGPSQESRVSAYRFGREEVKYSLQPNRLHYAEALLLAEWPVKRHRFALGLGWNYLLGIEGSLSRSRKGEFAIAVGAASSQEKGWLEEAGYKKQFWTARVAYHYQVLGRWSLGLDLQYVPGGILQKGTEGDPEIPLLKESGPVIIDLGIKYRL